jgi:hypothetical protein
MLVRQGGRLEDEPRLRITGICQRAAVDPGPGRLLGAWRWLETGKELTPKDTLPTMLPEARRSVAHHFTY